MTVLIGITGKRGSGKNTVAEYIKEWGESEGLKVELQGFADRLKLSFLRIFVPDATLEESLRFADWFKEYGTLGTTTPLPMDMAERFGQFSITGRQVLQNYGTEAHRQVFNDQFWVDQLLPIIEGDDGSILHAYPKFSLDTDIAVVYDARFPNEAERIIQIGGQMWRILRDEAVQTDTHASEQVLDEKYMSETIHNDGTLAELRQEVFFTMDVITDRQPTHAEMDEFQMSQLGEKAFHGH